MYDAPRTYATPVIYCFILPDDSPRKRHDSLSNNKCSRFNPVPSVYFYYIHTYIKLYREAKINAAPTPVNNRTVHAQEHVKCHITCNFNSFIHSFILIDSLPEKIPSSYYMPVAPNDGVLLHVLRTLFRLSRVLLDL